MGGERAGGWSRWVGARWCSRAEEETLIPWEIGSAWRYGGRRLGASFRSAAQRSQELCILSISSLGPLFFRPSLVPDFSLDISSARLCFSSTISHTLASDPPFFSSTYLSLLSFALSLFFLRSFSFLSMPSPPRPTLTLLSPPPTYLPTLPHPRQYAPRAHLVPPSCCEIARRPGRCGTRRGLFRAPARRAGRLGWEEFIWVDEGTGVGMHVRSGSGRGPEGWVGRELGAELMGMGEEVGMEGI